VKPWQFGNTSVRSATRLRDGLIVLADSGREGVSRADRRPDRHPTVPYIPNPMDPQAGDVFYGYAGKGNARTITAVGVRNCLAMYQTGIEGRVTLSDVATWSPIPSEGGC